MGGNGIMLPFCSRTERAQDKPSACWLASQGVGRWVVQAHLQCPPRRPVMIRMTRLPEEVTRLLAPLKPYLVAPQLIVVTSTTAQERTDGPASEAHAVWGASSVEVEHGTTAVRGPSNNTW